MKRREVELMFCKNCGTELNDESIFCTNCGGSIKTDDSNSSEQSQQQSQEYEHVQSPAQPQPQPYTYAAPAPGQMNYQTSPAYAGTHSAVPVKKSSNWLGLLLTFILPLPVAAIMLITRAPLWLWALTLVLFFVNLVIQFVLFRKGILPGLITVLVAVLVVSGISLGTYAAGSKENPGQSLKYLFRQPPVEWTQADLDSYLEKTGGEITQDWARAEDILTGDFVATQPLEIEEFFTNEEITALLNASAGETGIFQNVSMRYIGNDRMEATAEIGENLSVLIDMYPEVKNYEWILNQLKGQKVYMRTTLVHTTGNNFEAEIERFSIGSIPMPVDLINQNAVEAGSHTNSILDQIEGLAIEKFVITEEGIDFKGTIPQGIKRLG